MAVIRNIQALFNATFNQLDITYETDLVNLTSNPQVDFDLQTGQPQTSFGSPTPIANGTLCQVSCPLASNSTQFICMAEGFDPATGQQASVQSPTQNFSISGNNRVDKDDKISLALSAAQIRVGDTVRLEVTYLHSSGAPDQGIPIFFNVGPSVVRGRFSSIRGTTDANGKCAVDFTVTGLRVAGVTSGPIVFAAQAGQQPFANILLGILGLAVPPFDVQVARLVP